MRNAPDRVREGEKQEGEQRQKRRRIPRDRIVDDGSKNDGATIGIDRDSESDHGPIDIEALSLQGHQQGRPQTAAIEYKADHRSQNGRRKEAKNGKVDIQPRWCEMLFCR